MHRILWKMAFLTRHAFWIGFLITFAGFVSYFLVFARYPLFRDFPWINLPMTLLGLGLCLLGLVKRWGASRWFGKSAHLLGTTASVIITALFLGYVFGISYQMPEPGEKTLTLEKAPPIVLEDAEGDTVRLEDFAGQTVVLTFYRGHW